MEEILDLSDRALDKIIKKIIYTIIYMKKGCYDGVFNFGVLGIGAEGDYRPRSPVKLSPR